MGGEKGYGAHCRLSANANRKMTLFGDTTLRHTWYSEDRRSTFLQEVI
jgi:hypothetical protein